MSEQNKTKSPKAKSKQHRFKLSEGMTIAVIGLVGTIIASLLGSPLIEKWFVSTPVPTALVTSATTPTLQPTVQSQTLDSTPTPSTIEITDTKGVQMVFVPSGEFTMGSNGGQEDESPAHAVYLDAYFIDKYEVTNVLYKACVNTGVCKPLQNTNSYTHPNYYDNVEFENHPVVYVNWSMAETYCEWRGAHLPTEAQWEKAARGVDGRIYPWGSSFDGTVVNFCDVKCTLGWSDKNYDDGYEEIAPVGSFPKGISPYGVYDMAGNVYEWVADWYSPSYYRMTIDGNLDNPLGPSIGQKRVMRGGSWYYERTDMDTSYRNMTTPTDVYNDVGFRCAKDANQ